MSSLEKICARLKAKREMEDDGPKGEDSDEYPTDQLVPTNQGEGQDELPPEVTPENIVQASTSGASSCVEGEDGFSEGGDGTITEAPVDPMTDASNQEMPNCLTADQIAAMSLAALTLPGLPALPPLGLPLGATNFIPPVNFPGLAGVPTATPAFNLSAPIALPGFKGVLPAQSVGGIKQTYMIHFQTKEACRHSECSNQNRYTEHYHCLKCSKVFEKKEKAIRDIHWHDKQDRSMQFNFLRVGPSDPCSTPDCEFAGRKTHYHCMEPSCSKVCISTNEIQAHYNGHEKAAALYRDGFKRYRATDSCGLPSCPYFEDKTTHFHCIRDACTCTFKTKVDMEKHKGHHQKNDELLKDGFRKFYKYESCGVSACANSMKTNHVHCIREGCNYMIHSINQITSHKRKHDKYGKFAANTAPSSPQQSSSTSQNNIPAHAENNNSYDYEADGVLDLSVKKKNPTSTKTEGKELPTDKSASSVPSPTSSTKFIRLKSFDFQDFFSNYVRRYTANDPCSSHCPMLYQNHYHCLADKGSCGKVMKGKEHVREHGRQHAIMDEVARAGFRLCYDCPSGKEQHFHCIAPKCNVVVWEMASRFRFAHAQAHQRDMLEGKGQKRRRPKSLEGSSAKRREIASKDSEAVPQSDGDSMEHSQEWSEVPADFPWDDLSVEQFLASPKHVLVGFKLFEITEKCSDDECHLQGTQHFHCIRSRCNCVADSINEVRHHCVDFHGQVEIESGFEAYNFKANCHRSNCLYTQSSKHYHCIRDGCNESFYREKTMHQHSLKHDTLPFFTPLNSPPSEELVSCENPSTVPNAPEDTASQSVDDVFNGVMFEKIMRLISNWKMRDKATVVRKWSIELSQRFCPPATCILPFCKLKRTSHYHCGQCNAGISREERFLLHMRKHNRNGSTVTSESSTPSALNSCPTDEFACDSPKLTESPC